MGVVGSGPSHMRRGPSVCDGPLSGGERSAKAGGVRCPDGAIMEVDPTGCPCRLTRLGTPIGSPRDGSLVIARRSHPCHATVLACRWERITL